MSKNALAAATAVAGRTANPPTRGSERLEPAWLSRRATVLIADDNPNMLKIVERALKEQGIAVVAVDNGEVAVREIVAVRPQLVLADISMPGRNGYEVCRYVKSHPALCHVPVILLVGAYNSVDMQDAKRVQADGVTRKPYLFHTKPLISIVKAALARAAEAHDDRADEFTGPGRRNPSNAAIIGSPDESVLTLDKVTYFGKLKSSSTPEELMDSLYGRPGPIQRALTKSLGVPDQTKISENVVPPVVVRTVSKAALRQDRQATDTTDRFTNQAPASVALPASMKQAQEDVLKIAARLMMTLTPEERVIAVTAMSREDPSSVFSLSLALALGQLAQGPVLLVETDASARHACEILAAGPGVPGLREVLETDIEGSAAIRATGATNLFILPLGQPKETFTRGLSPDDCRRCFKSLKRFRYVMIHVGEVLVQSNAMLLASTSDALIAAIAPGRHTRRELRQLRQEVARMKCRFLGVALVGQA